MTKSPTYTAEKLKFQKIQNKVDFLGEYLSISKHLCLIELLTYRLLVKKQPEATIYHAAEANTLTLDVLYHILLLMSYTTPYS